MAQRRVLPQEWDKTVVLRLTFGLIVTAAALGAGIVWLWQTRRSMAEAETMLAVTPAPIDGERAYGYLKTICAIGPRPAGSEANARQRKLVAEHFQKRGRHHPRVTFSRCRSPPAASPWPWST